MSRLTGLLEQTMYHHPVTPIMVKTSFLQELSGEIQRLLPTKLDNRLKQLMPGITRSAETALATIKVNTLFKLISFPASLTLINKLSEDSRVEKIYLDRTINPTQTVPADGRYYDEMTKQTFTSTVWTKSLIGLDKAKAQGYTGEGTSITIIDTGASKLHQQTPHVKLHTTMPGMYLDENGHGEHVASTAGGKKATDPILRVTCEGMAPDADLTSIKTMGYVIGIGKESDTLEACSMAHHWGSNIVNMSLGAEVVPLALEDDPLSEAVTLLKNSGIIVVCAAGNLGPKSSTIISPGVSPDAITVGAWNEFESGITDFSSRGPVGNEIKPDIAAPGMRMHSALIGILDIQSDMRPQRFGYLSGTSMSTPHVSGLLACAKQMFNEAGIPLNSDVVKTIFQQYGTEKDNTQGHGLIQWDWFMDYARR